MNVDNDRRRPVRGSGVEKVTEQQTKHRVSRPTVPTRPRRTITGIVVVDLTDLGVYDSDDQVRMRLSVIDHCPSGAQVRINVGKVMPIAMNFDGIDGVGRVHVEVVGDDPNTVGRWVRMISEVVG